MKRFLKCAAVGLACWGMMTPRANLLAAEPVKSIAKLTVAKKITDVTLHKGGIVAGKVVDAQGHQVANLPAILRHKGKTVLEAKTRKDGTWVARGVRGGLHQVVVGRDQQVVRLWSPTTAPPTAKKYSTLVVSGKVVRGQDGYYYDPGMGAPPMDAGYATGAPCPPAAGGGGAGCGLGGGGGGFGGLDIITLATVGTSAAALVYAIDNNNRIKDLDDRFIAAPQSP